MANKTKELKLAWLVQAPEGSQLSGVHSTTHFLNLTPDMLGGYQVVLLAQDKNNLCASLSLNFEITSNEAYHGPFPNIQDPLQNNLNKLFQIFPHLKDIEADKAWNISTGDNIKIAVIDTGVNYNHPQLAAQIDVNTGEIPNNQIDDDNNGLVDDVVGFDFANNDSAPFDDNGHGSHVSGLIAAKDFGIAKNAKIIPIKALGNFSGDSGSIYGSIKYAVDRGAHIINMSLGGYGKLNPIVLQAIEYAEKNNVLIIAAAGNGHPQTGLGLNIDKRAIFPASFTNDNILSVAAHGLGEEITSYSNFGPESVDIVAPGGNERAPIVSCYVDSPQGTGYRGLMGTSMATPIASGVAALILSKNPMYSFHFVKDSLINTGKLIPGLEQLTKSGRHINALQALNYRGFNKL